VRSSIGLSREGVIVIFGGKTGKSTVFGPGFCLRLKRALYLAFAGWDLYIGKYPLPWGKISVDVIWGKI
jgi:hypothetical protein